MEAENIPQIIFLKCRNKPEIKKGEFIKSSLFYYVQFV